MKTETQQDHEVRIVSLANLHAMCSFLSSLTYKFQIEKVTRSRVHVSHIRPGFDSQGYQTEDIFVVAVFPCYPSTWAGDEENPRVVLDIMRVLYEDTDRDYDAGQYFEPLLDCPALWRMNSDSPDWKTRRQWEKEKGRNFSYPKKGSMVYDALPSILREYVDLREVPPPQNYTYYGLAPDGYNPETVNEEMEDLLEGFVHVYMRRSRKG